MHRRHALHLSLGALLAPGAARFVARVAAADHRAPRERFAAIELRLGARLGVAVYDGMLRHRLRYRADERFPMCSTFKWLLVAQVLARVDAGAEQLARIVTYTTPDLLEYAPITRAKLADGGMSIEALCDAAIRYSDNTAANLLLRENGGPAALTGFLRRQGDRVTRLDRIEPELNTAVPGDPRDTTSPDAMVGLMQTLLLGDRQPAASRARLIDWLVGNTTGGATLRAGLPPSWRVGDKTGRGDHGTTNDVAITWPDNSAPLLIATYLTGTDADGTARNAAHAEVAQVVTEWYRDTRQRR